MSSVSNGLYFVTVPLVSVMRVIYRKIRHARYLNIKRNVEKVWGARYTLGARYLSKNTVYEVGTLGTSVLIYQATWRYISDYTTVHSVYCWNSICAKLFAGLVKYLLK